MITITRSFTKLILVAVILALAGSAFSFTSTSAAGLNDEPSPTGEQPRNEFRLMRLWVRAQRIYDRQGDRLEKTDALIARVQYMIDKAEEKGWDTSKVQAALDDLASVTPAVQLVHKPGAAIIATHAGFDENGIVTNKEVAAETVRSLNDVIKDTRSAMNGTGEALRDAIHELRDKNRPNQ
jgi:hypothetical protein